MLPNTSGQHKNPWFYHPQNESNDGELNFSSLGRNLQEMVLEKIYDYQEQVNFEQTCKQAWSLFDGSGYRFRAAAVAVNEEEEEVIVPGQAFEGISSFTERGVQILADTLAITFADQEMDESRRLECVEKIQENHLQTTRLIIDIPVLELELFTSLIATTRPKTLVFSRPMPLEFLVNDYVCASIESLYLPEGMRVSEEEILRLRARELTVRCGILTRDGLVQIAQDFLSRKRSIHFVRIHLPTPTVLPDEEFESVGRLLSPVQFLDPKNFLITRPDDSKTLKVSLSNNCLTISEPWMIF